MFDAPVTAQSPVADRQALTLRQLNDRESFQRAQLTDFFRFVMKTFWNNPLGLTPQQVADALGTKAGLAFQTCGLIGQALTAAHKAAGVDDATLSQLLPSPTRPYTINADG